MSEGFNSLHHTFACKLGMGEHLGCSCGAEARFNSRLPTTAGRGEVSFSDTARIIKDTAKNPAKGFKTFQKSLRKAREADRIEGAKQSTGSEHITPELERNLERLHMKTHLAVSTTPDVREYRIGQSRGNVGSGTRTLGGDREAREQLQRDIAAANGREPAEQSKSGPPSEEVARQRERAKPERSTARMSWG